MARITIQIPKAKRPSFYAAHNAMHLLVFEFDNINADIKAQFFAENFDKITLEQLESLLK